MSINKALLALAVAAALAACRAQEPEAASNKEGGAPSPEGAPPEASQDPP